MGAADLNSEYWLEPLVEQWDTPLVLDFLPGSENSAPVQPSESPVHEHGLSIAPAFAESFDWAEALVPQGQVETGVDYWKEFDLP